MKKLVGSFVVVALALSGPAGATDLVVIQGVDPHASRYYGGSGWVDLTAEIDAAFTTVTVLPDATDLGALLAADRLWLDQRWTATLSQQEIDNITAFVATGRRAVFIGENNRFWSAWNDQILSIVGGSSVADSNWTAVSLGTDPVLNNGVTSIDLPTAGVAIGGTLLFDINWSTLWGNVVTALDVDVWWEWFAPDNAQYGRNVVEWLTGAGSQFPPVCFGDGSGAACGCGNESDGGSMSGCLNSVSTGGVGAALTASGSASASSPNLTLQCAGVRTQPGLLFQGNNTIGGGVGQTFGDGVRCCGGAVVRLVTLDPPAGPEPVTITHTETTAPGGVTAGDKRCYQYWYRDPGGPCGTNFNLSNAVTVTWGP